MLLIRGLSNLQSKGVAVTRRRRDSLLLREDMTKIWSPQGCVILGSQDFFFALLPLTITVAYILTNFSTSTTETTDLHLVFM